MGTSVAQTLCTGASNWSKASLSIQRAAISAPTPHCGQPSSTVTNLCVFITDFKIPSLSKGRSVRRLMTSQFKPKTNKNKTKLAFFPSQKEVGLFVFFPEEQNLAEHGRKVAEKK
jgi:hypothetical protein